jgi:hypothetical protein
MEKTETAIPPFARSPSSRLAVNEAGGCVVGQVDEAVVDAWRQSHEIRPEIWADSLRRLAPISTGTATRFSS